MNNRQTYVTIQFEAVCHDFNEDLKLFISGNVFQLGNWDTNMAIPMNFIDGVWKANIQFGQNRINQTIEYKMFKKIKRNQQTHLIWQKFSGNRFFSFITFSSFLIKLQFDNNIQNIIPKTIKQIPCQHCNIYQVLQGLDKLKNDKMQGSDEEQDKFHEYQLLNYFKYCQNQQKNQEKIRARAFTSQQIDNDKDW